MRGDPGDPAASGSFCILPWLHLEVTPEGACKACCVAQEAVHAGREPLNVGQSPLQEVRRSRYMRSLRTALASGRKVPVCSYCWDQERRGETSARQGWNRHFRDAIARLRERTRQGTDAAEELPLEYLQLSLGNTCNLACRMCNASYSSRIEADPVHSRWSPRMDRGRTVWDPPGGTRLQAGPPGRRWPGPAPWFQQPEFFRQDLLGSGGSLRLLYVTGGEPLMSDDFARLLDAYVAQGHAGSMHLNLNSNLFHNEARLRRVLDSLLRFAGCTLGASVDGYAAAYEYIRYPGRWDVVARNLELVRDLSRQDPRLACVVDIVVQPYNSLSLTELLRFADGLGLECYPHVIEGPAFLRMQVVPRPLRLEAARRLQAYAAAPAQPGPAATNRAHAQRIARHLESIREVPWRARRLRRRFLEFTRALDAARGQRLADAAPELAAALA